MNNQIPFGFIPNFNYEQINDKINQLEQKIKLLERKIKILENNTLTNYNKPMFPNNYM